LLSIDFAEGKIIAEGEIFLMFLKILSVKEIQKLLIKVRVLIVFIIMQRFYKFLHICISVADKNNSAL